MPEELNKIIQSICKKIEELSAKEYFSVEYIEKIKYRKHNELSSRMLGIISSIGTELGYIVDIGRGIKPSNTRKFNPDILFLKDKKLIALFEYESTNSSDYRILSKDLKNFKASAISDIELPKFWLIITTLPNKQVSSWSNWRLSEWAKKFGIRKTKNKLYYQLKENPKTFYYRGFLSEFEKVDKNLFNNSKLFLLNLNSDGITLEFPLKRVYPIKWKIKTRCAT